MKKVINYMFVVQAVLCAVPAIAASEQVGFSERERVCRKLDEKTDRLGLSVEMQRSKIEELRALSSPESGYHGQETKMRIVQQWWQTLRSVAFGERTLKPKLEALLELQRDLYSTVFSSGDITSFLRDDLGPLLPAGRDFVSDLIREAEGNGEAIEQNLNFANQFLKEGSDASALSSARHFIEKNLVEQEKVLNLLTRARKALQCGSPQEEPDWVMPGQD